MVFKSVSWQAFLVVALALAGIWYLVVLPLLYRRQLKDWLGSRKGKPDLRRVCRDWDGEVFEEPLPEAEDELIGKPKLPDGLSRVGMNMFGFASPLDVSDESREVQQSLVPDVIEELKSIFHIL